MKKTWPLLESVAGVAGVAGVATTAATPATPVKSCPRTRAPSYAREAGKRRAGRMIFTHHRASSLTDGRPDADGRKTDRG